MKISASAYASSGKTFEAYIKALDACKGVDMFHLDFDETRQDFSILANDVKKIRAISSKPIDLHLISSRPSKYLDVILHEKIEYVNIQLETLCEPLVLPQTASTAFGLSIITATPISVFEEYQERCPFISLMCTTPGKSGGRFNRRNLQKMKRFKRRFPNHQLYIDGGVNGQLGVKMKHLGADRLVIGSYLAGSEDLELALLPLRNVFVT